MTKKKGTQKFGSMRYKYTGYEDTKSDANLHAERIRSRGELARVTPCDEGYCVFKHKTKSGAKKARRSKKHGKEVESMKKSMRLYPYD